MWIEQLTVTHVSLNFDRDDFKAQPSWLSVIDKDLQCGTKDVGPSPPLFLAHENVELGQAPCPFALKAGKADAQPCPFA